MKIGIIGAGQIGGTLTRRLRALGHEVHVANSGDPRTLAGLVTETGAVAAKDAGSGRGQVWAASVRHSSAALSLTCCCCC